MTDVTKAMSQACAVCSPPPSAMGILSVMGIFRQLSASKDELRQGVSNMEHRRHWFKCSNQSLLFVNGAADLWLSSDSLSTRKRFSQPSELVGRWCPSRRGKQFTL